MSSCTSVMTSELPTRFPVNCPVHGLVYLSEEEGARQEKLPGSQWLCPIDRDFFFFNDSSPELVAGKFVGNFGKNPKRKIDPKEPCSNGTNI